MFKKIRNFLFAGGLLLSVITLMLFPQNLFRFSDHSQEAEERPVEASLEFSNAADTDFNGRPIHYWYVLGTSGEVTYSATNHAQSLSDFMSMTLNIPEGVTLAAGNSDWEGTAASHTMTLSLKFDVSGEYEISAVSSIGDQLVESRTIAQISVVDSQEALRNRIRPEPALAALLPLGNVSQESPQAASTATVRGVVATYPFSDGRSYLLRGVEIQLWEDIPLWPDAQLGSTIYTTESTSANNCGLDRSSNYVQGGVWTHSDNSGSFDFGAVDVGSGKNLYFIIRFVFHSEGTGTTGGGTEKFAVREDQLLSDPVIEVQSERFMTYTGEDKNLIVNMPNLGDASTLADEATHVFYDLSRSYGYLRDCAAFTPDNVTVLIDYPDTSSPDSTGTTINFDGWNTDYLTYEFTASLIHEYAHSVHYAMRGGTLPPRSAGDTNHGGCANTTSSDGLTEGWARFAPARILNTNDYRWGSTDTPWDISLNTGENAACDKDEWTVGSILWDVWTELGSGVDTEFLHIASTLYTWDPDYVQNYYNDFVFDWGLCSSVRQIFLNHNVNYPDCSAPGGFNKSAPANGATGQVIDNLVFSWQSSSTAVSYEYCVDTINNNACDDTWINVGTSTSVNKYGLNASTTYYWQVRAVNAYGRTYANTATWWSFATSRSNVCGTISSNTTWRAINSPYVIICDVTVASGVTLTIDPGVVVKFQYQSNGIYKRRMLVDGVLDLLGTGGAPVVFTSERDDSYGGDTNGDGPTTTPGVGDWGYIKINNAATDFNHAIVRYGGYYAYDGSNAMVWINGVAPVIQNNTFERSYDKAVYVQNGSPTFANNTFAYSPNGLVLDGGGYTTPANGVLSNNTFSNNTYPVWQLNYAFPTYSGNTFTGNARQAIAVSGGISAVIAAPRTQAWPDVQGLGLPYMVVGDLTVGSYVTLQIDPGVVVKFQYQSSSIYKRRMLVSGVLDLLGTDGSPVVFTSERDDTYGGDANGDGPTTAPAPGDWGYIRIDTATTDFQHGIVRYGGYYAYDGANSMLWVNSASPTIQNNTFERAYDKAVFVAGGNAAIVNNNISNNAHYGVYVQSGSPTINYNDIYGNVDYGVYNGNSAVTVNATNNWWGNASGPSGAGLGSGDRVSTYVNFNLWTGNPYAPPATASVQASDGTFADKVQVTWAASVRATTYMVYRAASPTGTKSFLGSSIGTSYDDTRSAASVVFYYWVAGCNSTGCSDYGSSDTGWRNIFYPPANLQASNGTYTDKVQVTWEAVSGATLFEVYRADSVTGSKSLLGSPAASPYDDTSAAPVVTYYYWAKACNGATCSSFSDTDSGWRSLSAPANVQASDGIYTDKVSVSWDTLPGATYYEVYRAATAGGTKSLLGSPVASPYDDATAAVGTTYFYWVKACKSSICSDFSAYDLGWRNLPAPVDVQASDGAYTDKVRVVWNAVADAASYLVYRAESAGGTRSLLGNPADASFDDTTATPVATYYYWVRACTSLSYCSNESAYDTGWRNLVAPTVVVASDGTFTDKVQVTWNASEGATSYEVYRADTADGAKTLLGSPAVSPYDDLSAASFVTYYYWVKACRAGMCSDFSASDTGWKNLPVQASDGTYADKVKIAWDAVAGSTSYKVYRATSAGGTKAQIGNPTATQYNDTSAVAGATYYYWVRSCVGATCSNYSASDSGWRNYLPPINIQASDGEYLDKVQVTWDAHASAASYEVYRSDSAGGTKSLLGSPTATSFDDTTASPGTTYYYFVKACFSLGCTAFSASDNGWRTLTAPTTVQASDGAFTDKVQIAWTAASGATSYQVYRADTADGTKSLLGSAAASPYDDATAIARITYYYWVKSCLAANCSDFSASDAGWREITYPGNVRASDGTFTDKVQVSWNASSGALSYRVYRATSATGSKTLLGSPAASPYNDTSGTPGASYYYWVKTCTATLCSDFSASDTGWRKLTAPTGLAASDGAYTDKVTLSWTASAGATSYQVYRATSATGAKAGPATTAATFTNDTTATPGVTYYYFVKACRGANCSDFSVYDTGWRNLAPPTNVQASDGTFTDKVQITWTASLGATSYKLYRAASVDGAKTLLGSTTSTTANDTSATPGATYYYWVTACRGTVCSDYSVYDTGRR